MAWSSLISKIHFMHMMKQAMYVVISDAHIGRVQAGAGKRERRFTQSPRSPASAFVAVVALSFFLSFFVLN